MDHKAFNKWCDQYTDESNFSDENSHMVARMLLCSLWMAKDKEIKKLRAVVDLLLGMGDWYGKARHHFPECPEDDDIEVRKDPPWGDKLIPGKRARETTKRAREILGEA